MAKEKPVGRDLVIQPPKMLTANFTIMGDAPLVMNAFSQKARNIIRASHEAGSTRKKGQKREPKNFQECYEGSMHRTEEGWVGIPASGFRNAMISACRMAGFKMTHAKLSIKVIADGFDKTDGTPLVKISKGKPSYVEHYVRNETGVVDLRARAKWDPGWEAEIRVQFDGDQFTTDDVANLLLRAGMQVGILEGRPDSKKSAGMGWGTFLLKGRD